MSWIPIELVTIVIGQKRAGKSTLASRVAYECHKKGIKVYSNYPIKYAIQLPQVRDKSGRLTLDKRQFYTMNMDNSVVIVDEVAGIWNARSYNSFTEEDSNFFNYLGHTNTRVLLIAQFWDMIDLNLRRSAGEIWFVKKSILGFSKIEKTDVTVDKVRNLDEDVLAKGYDCIDFKIVMSDRIIKRLLWRPRWYNNFDSYYLDREYKTLDLPAWDSLVNFPYPKKWYFKFLKT